MSKAFTLKERAETAVYDTNGDLALKVQAAVNNEMVIINLEGEYIDLTICMRNVHHVGSVCGAVYEDTELGVVLHVISDTVTFRTCAASMRATGSPPSR